LAQTDEVREFSFVSGRHVVIHSWLPDFKETPIDQVMAIASDDGDAVLMLSLFPQKCPAHRRVPCAERSATLSRRFRTITGTSPGPRLIGGGELSSADVEGGRAKMLERRLAAAFQRHFFGNAGCNSPEKVDGCR
jgi:hypothetical protein